jgi:hypothetical protein
MAGARWCAGALQQNWLQDLSRSRAVYHKTQPQLNAGVCAALVYVLRVLLRLAEGRHALISALGELNVAVQTGVWRWCKLGWGL